MAYVWIRRVMYSYMIRYIKAWNMHRQKIGELDTKYPSNIYSSSYFESTNNGSNTTYTGWGTWFASLRGDS